MLFFHLLQVFKRLQQKSRYPIGRIYIAGSAGKKTTTFNWDMDLVLFINDEQPPFKEVLDNFEDTFLIENSLDIKNIRKTPYSIQFTIGQIDFDILPAPNFVTRDSGRADADELQQQRTLDRIKCDPAKYGYMYSGGLAQASINFMKRQDDFAHDMVRLAKFWFKSLFNEYVSGGKLLVELVAVYAAQKEANYPSKSQLRCFTTFIHLMQNFECLDVVFEGEYKFREHQVTDNSRPRVMDPINPYNNLARNWSVSAQNQIKRYANETYRRLQNIYSTRKVDYNILFDYQGFPRPPVSVPIDKVKWYYDVGQATRVPDLKIRNETKRSDPINALLLQGTQHLLQHKLNSTLVSDANDENNIEINITEGIDTHIRGQPHQAWSPAFGVGASHEEYDATFTIPMGDKGKSVKLSLNMM